MAMSKLLSEEELEKQIYDITQTMLIALSEWQSGTSIDYTGIKAKGRHKLLALIQSQKKVHANKVVRSIKSKMADKSIVVTLNEFQSGYDTAIVDCIEIVGADIRERNK